MKTPTVSTLTTFTLLIFSCSWAASSNYDHHDFLRCLSEKFNNHHTSISKVVYTPTNSSYTSILRFSIHNLRFRTKSTPKPLVIITPENESQIPPVIYCAKQSNTEIRTRSGGHDYEGLSYTSSSSQVPFAIVDLINLSETTVDVDQKTAWVQAGATIGSVYYRIAEKSPVLGFPAGVCPTVGVGGHFSGGGYGGMMRRFGLAADNIIDAKIVDVDGRILDRKSMGEDLFWAIRGGGGASFGVILAWKLQLVDIPERVTGFVIEKTLGQNMTQIVHRWQDIAHRLDQHLFISIAVRRAKNYDGGNVTVHATFNGFFHGEGGVERLLQIMQESFPELGVVREDCIEMRWIESLVEFTGFPKENIEVLMSRVESNVRYFKSKSDYVMKPIPEHGLKGIWRLFYEPEAEAAEVILTPYGGRMAEIPESAIPFPHRAGNLYKIEYTAFWQEDEARNSEKYIDWTRTLYSYLTPYVSKSPRAAYVNNRDLDIGVNSNDGETSYEQARIWGTKYFKSNFDRLVRVKTMVDPDNFFRNEQSIPSLVHSRWRKGTQNM